MNFLYNMLIHVYLHRLLHMHVYMYANACFIPFIYEFCSMMCYENISLDSSYLDLTGSVVIGDSSMMIHL